MPAKATNGHAISPQGFPRWVNWGRLPTLALLPG